MADEAVIYADCECGGERYPVVVQGADLETMTFSCPACGKPDSFSPEQVQQLKAHFGDAVGPLSGTTLN